MVGVLRECGGDSQIDFVSALNALLDESKDRRKAQEKRNNTDDFKMEEGENWGYIRPEKEDENEAEEGLNKSWKMRLYRVSGLHNSC